MACGSDAHAAVRYAPLFTDHMVLQRDMRVKVWGTAAPDENLTINFKGQISHAAAGKDGKWSATIGPFKVGEPDTLTAGDQVLKDVVVGDVWLGSGQSNMAMISSAFTKDDPALAEAVGKSYPQIRVYQSGGRGWGAATPEVNANTSALLIAFGVALQKEIDVPVGLIFSAASGSPSGRWLTKDMMVASPGCLRQMEAYRIKNPPEVLEQRRADTLAKWQQTTDAAKKNGTPAPSAPPPAISLDQAIDLTNGDLYRTYMRPFIGFTVRGILWDQGESGTGLPGLDQYVVTSALIRGWRKDWAQGDIPFLLVQKPSGLGCAWDAVDPITRGAMPYSAPTAFPPDPQAGFFREAHVRLIDNPATTLVITSDMDGMAHPLNKWGYGVRSARAAMAAVYQRNIPIYGPMYDSHKVEGSRVRMSFKHVGSGLAIRHADKLTGFWIAGDDRNFFWADAVIDGDQVLVSSAQVPHPVAVRYAWGHIVPWANLFNKDHLPAQIFRTDSWDLDGKD